ncbi:MAG TPA: sugar phosphate isomerase/epimerase family protein [Abditibacteriaceae bacterium]|jgi:sugar phosphate isomerase/epimerase
MAKQWALGVMTGMSEGPLTSLRAVRELGIDTVQLQYPHHLDTPEGVREILAAVEETGVEITLVFCGFDGESYADIPTVCATVGLVPESTRAARVAHIRTISLFAQRLGVSRIAAHIGFIPEDEAHPLYQEIRRIVREICDDLATREQTFVLETGQETARGLKHFLSDVARPNLLVNFDPANMILYGNDEPMEALDILHPWIDSVHCKDGLWPTKPDALGLEVPFGEGAVHAEAWLRKLIDTGYVGPLTIEREIEGNAQTRDILTAKTLIEAVLEKRAALENS